MPIVRIEDAAARAEQRQAIIHCVYDALRAVFGVSDEELQARYQRYAPEDLLPPGGDPDYLHIEITVFAGRKPDTKKNSTPGWPPTWPRCWTSRPPRC